MRIGILNRVIIIAPCCLVIYCYSFAQGYNKYKEHVFSSSLEQSVLSFSDSNHNTRTLLKFSAYDSTVDLVKYNAIETEVDEFIEKLKAKKQKFKNEEKFIKYSFNKTKSTYLIDYQKYVPFNEIFTSRQFNCLTGTALYVYILESLGYRTKIYETHFHCFLTICDDNREIALVDAADKLGGVITDSAQIQKRIQLYQRNESQIASDENMFPVGHYPKIKSITINELAGLQYFNFAVVDFNSCEYKEAYFNLVKGLRLYPTSERIADLIFYLSKEKREILPKNFSITGN